MGDNYFVTKRLSHFFTQVFSASLLEPIILVSFYIGFLYLLNGALPSSGQLVSHLSSLYERYGYEILFLGAMLETLVVVNLFAPGMIALAFGGVFARTGELDLTLAILSAVSGGVLGYTVDFFLGYFGFSKIVTRFVGQDVLAKMKQQIEKFGIRSFSLGFFHPNIGSMISLAAGTIEMKFVTFFVLASLSTLVWFSFWGFLVYSLGDVVLTILEKYLSVVGMIITSVWLFIFLYSRFKRKGENVHP